MCYRKCSYGIQNHGSRSEGHQERYARNWGNSNNIFFYVVLMSGFCHNNVHSIFVVKFHIRHLFGSKRHGYQYWRINCFAEFHIFKVPLRKSARRFFRDREHFLSKTCQKWLADFCIFLEKYLVGFNKKKNQKWIKIHKW